MTNDAPLTDAEITALARAATLCYTVDYHSPSQAFTTRPILSSDRMGLVVL
jgi:hypothetical protein